MSRTTHRASIATKAFLVFLLWSIVSWGVPGCVVGDFVGAYFNTYYNAQRLFGEAENELFLVKENKSVERFFGFTFTIQPSTKTKFTSVIEKCSKLLQYHPDSKLVDDAILMIGKSYYYQNQFQQAERKFTELIEQFPNSNLAPESKLLLGYCYYMDNEKPKASGVAKALLDESEKDGDDEYAAKASMLLAQLEVDSKNIDQAKTLYQAAAEKGRTSAERFAAYLNLASLTNQEGNYQRALDAYRKAGKESSGFETAYKATIGEARVLSKLGGYEESLALLRDMIGSSNFKEFYPEISLEIGNVFKEKKEYISAIEQYIYVDTTYARTESAANSYFQLGDLYESRTMQWDSALVYFSKGKTEYPQAPITTQLARRSDYLAKYVQHRAAIQRYDSIKSYILTPRDSIPIHLTAADSVADSLHAVRDSAIVRAPAPSTFTLDSINALLARETTEMASLLYSTMELPDSAAFWYRVLLNDYPNSRQVPRALFSLAQIYSQDTSRSHSLVDSLYREIVNRFPDSEFKPEAERLLGLPIEAKITDPAEGAYARAENLLNAGNSKEAKDTLLEIVRSYPSSPFASKAQYALGWIYERVKVQPDSAIASYKKLVALYPTSKYAGVVRPMIEAYDLSKREAAKDSASSAVSDSLSTKHDQPEKNGAALEPKKPSEPAIEPPKEKPNE